MAKEKKTNTCFLCGNKFDKHFMIGFDKPYINIFVCFEHRADMGIEKLIEKVRTKLESDIINNEEQRNGRKNLRNSKK